MVKLEEFEEIDFSGNKLKVILIMIMNCRCVYIVIVYFNCIEVFFEVMQFLEIKCVDLSCNELSEVILLENLFFKLQELDLIGNFCFVFDYKILELLNNICCFKIDQFFIGDVFGVLVVWSYGYIEVLGVKNKLCVVVLLVNNFCDNCEVFYGVFDGDWNVEVFYFFQCIMSDILVEEL